MKKRQISYEISNTIINFRTVKKFINTIEQMDICSASIMELNNLIRFSRVMKLCGCNYHVPLFIIKKKIIELGLIKFDKCKMLNLEYFFKRKISRKPKLETWILIMEILSQIDNCKEISEMDKECNYSILTYFTPELIDIFFEKDTVMQLFLSCSIFGAKRFYWLNTHWNNVSDDHWELISLIISQTYSLDNKELFKLLCNVNVNLLIPNNYILHIFQLGYTVSYYSSDLSWKCLYLLFLKCPIKIYVSVTENDINAIEIIMSKVFNKCSSDAKINYFKMGCAINFLISIQNIVNRTQNLNIDLYSFLGFNQYISKDYECIIRTINILAIPNTDVSI
jgi:frataxin-like iron-binding protein CyaY